MSSRIFSAAFALLLAACGSSPEGAAPESGGNAAGDSATTQASGEHIACAVTGAGYANVCTIDRATTAQGQVLTIRHPDGGFRRLLMSHDGSGVTAADGALPIEVLGRGERGLEVAVGDARYRLPPAR